MALSKQSILSHAGVFKHREVHVPAWRDENGDDVVLVRGMTIREFEINQARASEGLATALVLTRCIVEPDGARVFRDSDAEALAELPMAQVQDLSAAILEESGITGGDDKAVEKAVEDAEGNSVPTTGDEPSSA